MLKFQQWFKSASKSFGRSPKRTGRRKLRLEGLEGRDLLSAVAIIPKAAPIGPPTAPAMVAPPIVQPSQNTLAAAASISSASTATASADSESALVAGINAKRFDGKYAGKYTYKFNGRKFTANLRFTVTNGVAKVTIPGRGAGRINAQANINFKITGNTRLKGHFTLIDTDSAKANGTFTKMVGARAIKGTWVASRFA